MTNSRNEWIFEWQGQAKHVPCNASAYTYKGIISCSHCDKHLPEELELPAQVFGAYGFISYKELKERFDQAIKQYINKTAKDLEVNYFKTHQDNNRPPRKAK